jgi:hypothetical protein
MSTVHSLPPVVSGCPAKFPADTTARKPIKFAIIGEENYLFLFEIGKNDEKIE